MNVDEDINDLISNEPIVDPPIEPEPAPEPAPVDPPTEPAPVIPQEPPAEPPGEPVPPPTDPPAVPAPTVEPPPASDPRDAQIAQMMETIAALQKTINDVASARNVEPPTPPAPTEPKVHKFFEKDEEVDEALKTVEGVNGMLSKVVDRAQEQILSIVPQIVAQISNYMISQRFAANDFYQANPDLSANKAFVGMVADEVAAAHPDWDMFKVMEGLADEVRSRLRLSGQVTPQPAAIPQPLPTDPPAPAPAFAGTRGPARSGGGTPTLTPIEKEISDLIDGFLP